MTPIIRLTSKEESEAKSESGFSLVETVIAMLVMTVMMLGTLTVFTYAVQYNRGNNLRSQTLTVLQKQAELYRSAKFTPSVVDPTLTGGTTTTTTDTQTYPGTSFTITTTVDNNPSTPTVVDSTPADNACTFKEIKVIVKPTNTEEGWRSAVVSTLIIQRVRGN